MSWKGKLLIGIAAAILLTAIFFMIYVVRAKYRSNEYILQLGAAFNAAILVNGDETLTDPEYAVISEYDGKKYLIVPENYKALNTLLRKDAVMPIFGNSLKDAPLSIRICDTALVRIRPNKHSVDGASIYFDTGTQHFYMHVKGGNIWTQILSWATKGSTHYDNIPLE